MSRAAKALGRPRRRALGALGLPALLAAMVFFSTVSLGSAAEPEWFPLRGTHEIGCTQGNPSPSGADNCTGYHPYSALDIDATTSDNVYAAGGGTVYSLINNQPQNCPNGECAGNRVVVAHPVAGGTVYSLYLHLSSVSVSQGQAVDQNTVLGKAGQSGLASPGYVHLHFELRLTPGGSPTYRNGLPLKACVDGQLRIYPGAAGAGSWPTLPRNTPLRSDGTSCASPPPPPAPDADVLRNGSFEQNTAAWSKSALADQVNIAAYVNRSYAKEGDHYLEANTAKPSGSIAQDIAVPSGGANRSYTLSMWIRKAPGTGVDPKGTLVLWDLGGARNSQTSVTLTDRWQLVSAPISITGTGATTLRAEFYMGTTGVNYDFDGAQLVRAGLRDASFELGAASWSKFSHAAQTNIAAYQNPAIAREGSWFFEANTSVSGGSFGQDVSIPAGPAGRSYTFSIWVRRPAGSPASASGSVVLWDLGGGPRQHATNFTLTDTWTLVSAPIWVEGTGAGTLRAEVYMHTTGVNYDFDGAQLVHTGLLNASFEQGTPGWTKSANADKVNIAGYTNQAYAKEGAGYLEANTAVPGGSIAQDAGVPAGPAGRTYTYAVWMRKAPGTSGSPTGSLALWDLGGGPVNGTTNFTLTDAWTLVSAPVSVAGAGASSLRAEVYMNTTGVNYDFDGATLAAGNQAEIFVAPPTPPAPPAPTPPAPSPPAPTTSGGGTTGSGGSLAGPRGSRPSFGPKLCTVPRLAGLIIKKAKAKLVRNGCKLGAITYVGRKHPRADKVIKVKRRIGLRLGRGAKVGIVVRR